jgi:hypothetical protein
VTECLSGVDDLELYDLQRDVSESWDLAEHPPEIVERLLETMEDFDREFEANRRPPALRP